MDGGGDRQDGESAQEGDGEAKPTAGRPSRRGGRLGRRQSGHGAKVPTSSSMYWRQEAGPPKVQMPSVTRWTWPRSTNGSESQIGCPASPSAKTSSASEAL